jgi:hypothetical protein
VVGRSSAGSSAGHSNVYVKNLADHVDDFGLCQMFEKFGVIKTACVMLDPATKRSRNFGFVKFEVRACKLFLRFLLHSSGVQFGFFFSVGVHFSFF